MADKSKKKRAPLDKPRAQARVDALATVAANDKPAPLVVVHRAPTPYMELRQARAYLRHCQGKTYREIGDELGISREQARLDVDVEYARIKDEHKADIERERRIQVDRCQQRIRALQAIDCSGDMNPAQSRAQIEREIRGYMEQMNKLQGLEAATKIDINQKIQLTEERRVLIAKISGTIGATPILDVFGPPEDQEQGRLDHTVSGEPPATSLSGGETASP